MKAVEQLRSVARLVARGVAARRGSRALTASPRRRLAVERRGIAATDAEVARYLAATGGAGLQTGWLPPLYACTWETLLALDLLSQLEPPLPLGPVVHTRSEVLIARLPRPGDELRCRVEVEGMQAVPAGLEVRVTARNWTVGGQLCTEAAHVFRVRTATAGAARTPREAPSREGWMLLAEWKLPSGAGRRYARASGDWNPIHLWWWTSRPLGFPRPILHGFCTAALVAHTCCRELWDGDPRALRRLRVAFRSPLALPAEAQLHVQPADSHLDFRVTDASGERLFAEGSAGGGRV